MNTDIVKCPAGEEMRGPFSQNKKDILCRISTNMRRAEGSVCCAGYADCPIWVQRKKAEDANKKISEREIPRFGDM